MITELQSLIVFFHLLINHYKTLFSKEGSFSENAKFDFYVFILQICEVLTLCYLGYFSAKNTPGWSVGWSSIQETAHLHFLFQLVHLVNVFVLLAYLKVSTFNQINVLVAAAFFDEDGTFGHGDRIERG